MEDVVEIPDENSSDNDVQEQPISLTNSSFDRLKSLKSEMEFRGSLLGKTWSELSQIMSKYQAEVIEKHEQLDSSLTSVDHFRISQVEQELKRSGIENVKLQKQVTDLESKILEKDSEIVTLRTEVHKFRNEVSMKDNLIQKIQGQMAQEALDYQTEITSLRDMLDAVQSDYGMNVTTVPVPIHQPVKRRKVMSKSQVQRTPTSMSPAKSTHTSRITPTAPAHALGISMEQSTPATIKTESFQISCQMAGPSSDQTQQNEMDSSFTATDQSYNELHDSNQEQNFFKMDEVYEGTDAANLEGLMQEQDPNMLLENAPGQEQECDEAHSMMELIQATPIKQLYVCTICNKDFKGQYYLDRHSRIHLNIKPFHCLVCEKTFSDRSNALNHISKVHKVDDPRTAFKCEKN